MAYLYTSNMQVCLVSTTETTPYSKCTLLYTFHRLSHGWSGWTVAQVAPGVSLFAFQLFFFAGLGKGRGVTGVKPWLEIISDDSNRFTSNYNNSGPQSWVSLFIGVKKLQWGMSVALLEGESFYGNLQLYSCTDCMAREWPSVWCCCVMHGTSHKGGWCKRQQMATL